MYFSLDTDIGFPSSTDCMKYLLWGVSELIAIAHLVGATIYRN